MKTTPPPITPLQSNELRTAIRDSGIPVATIAQLAGIPRERLEWFMSGLSLRQAWLSRLLTVNAVRRGLGLEVSR